VSSRQACRLASLASLAKVCLSQPVRRQTMRIFSQFACGLRMELSACSGRVSAPKTEGADAGQLQRRGGLSRHLVLSFIHAVCVWRNSTGRYSRSFRGKSTLPQSTRMESLGAARGFVSFGGKCGACTFQTQGPLKHTNSVQQSIILHASWPVDGAVSQEALTQQ
jgi:hypothetical protein